MHAAVVIEPNDNARNGSFSSKALDKLITNLQAVAISDLGAKKMEMDEILRILTLLQVEGARRDAKLDQVIAGLKEINDFRVDRVKVVDLALDELRRRSSAFERRMDAIEEKQSHAGILGWIDGSTAKKIGALTALIVGAGAAIVVITKMMAWLSAHFHF